VVVQLPSGKLTTFENGHLYLISPFKMVMFHSYVSLPEGIPRFYIFLNVGQQALVAPVLAFTRTITSAWINFQPTLSTGKLSSKL
jgi:hypothetical protein